MGYKMIGVRSSSGNRLLIEQQLADKPWKLDWFYEVRHLSTSLGLVEAGLAFWRFMVWQCPMRPILRLLVFHWWYCYTSDIGDYSPQRCRAFSGSRTLFCLAD